MRTIHPTKQLLLDTAVALIDEHGPQGFTVDNLLDNSKISKGSLYHHFEDFHNVIEEAQVVRFARFVDEDIRALASLLTTANSREELSERFVQLVLGSASTGGADNRLDRASIVGLSRHSKKFADALAIEQQRLTDSLADVGREMQERGWITDEVDVVALATFVQAYSFGFVLNDIAEKSISVQRWANFVGRVLWRSL